MSPENLQKLLTQPYNRTTFINGILLPVWQGKVDTLVIYDESRTEDIDLTDGEEAIAQSVIKYGEIITADKKTIDLFEVTLQDSKVIERNKVSVGNIVKKHIIGNNAVFASFAYADASDRNWRFSFIAFDSQFEDGDVVQIETNPKRYTYVLGPGESCRTAADRFTSLAAKPSIELSHIKEAFSVEKISKDFFNDYREHYQNFCEYLTGKRMVTEKGKQVEKKMGNASPFLKSAFEGNEKFARDFAKKLMGRVVFLYFIQKKGWMGASSLAYEDGNLNFMQDFFTASGKGQDFYPKYLSKLFFDTLNNPDRKEDTFTMPDRSNVKIPYLNGGLFEQEAAAYADITFPPALFEVLFELFNQYNFTIYEDSPEDHTVAVDPEMLGHIFENLLEDNKDKGAFYTPKQIVHYMTQESLLEYLLTHLPKLTRKDLETFIKDKVSNGLKPDQLKEIGTLLDKVKICDPAIGSGAFPMGLLQEIFSLKELIAFETGQDWNPVKAKENIIQNSIYGVDIEKGAVDIARLRFWLSLVVDELTPKPLPNLDYKIMQGNSLLESYEGVDLSKVAAQPDVKMIEPEKDLFGNFVDPQLKITHFKSENAAKIEGLIHKYFGSTSPQEKSQLRKQIDQIVKEHIEYNLELRELQLERWISDAGKYDNLSKPNQKKYDSWKKDLDKIADLKANLDTQMASKEKNYFLWHLYFKEVFDADGFDIVIGNPPYFVYEKDHSIEIEEITSDPKYDIARSGKLNAYKVFLALCPHLQKKQSGLVCFIFQNSFLGDTAAKNLRKYFLEEQQIIKIDSFPERDNVKKRVFESAKMSVCVFMARNIKPSKAKDFELIIWEDLMKTQKGYCLLSKEEIYGFDPISYQFPMLSESEKSIFSKFHLSDNTQKLSEVAPCYRGELNMTTERRFFTSKPNQYMAMKGSQIQKYFITNNMSQGTIEYVLRDQYLTENKGSKSRHHEFKRIVTQRITGVNEKIRIKATILESGNFCADSCNYLLSKNPAFSIELVLGFINSKLFNWVFKKTSTNSNVNGYEVDSLSIPKVISSNLINKIEGLVNQIINDKNQLQQTKSLEQEIDTIVFKLYDLTYEEVLEVLHSTDPDGEFWMSKEEYEGYELG